MNYRTVVKPEGNVVARALIDEVFEPADASWRGLGDNSRKWFEIKDALRCL